MHGTRNYWGIRYVQLAATAKLLKRFWGMSIRMRVINYARLLKNIYTPPLKAGGVLIDVMSLIHESDVRENLLINFLLSEQRSFLVPMCMPIY